METTVFPLLFFVFSLLFSPELARALAKAKMRAYNEKAVFRENSFSLRGKAKDR